MQAMLDRSRLRTLANAPRWTSAFDARPLPGAAMAGMVHVDPGSFRPVAGPASSPMRPPRGLRARCAAATEATLRQARSLGRVVGAWRRPTRRPVARTFGSAACLRGLARHRGGATAIEFALLALPFLALLCVVAESGVAILSQQTLDIAIDRASRQLRTGAFQEGADGVDPTQRFRRVACADAVVLFACSALRIEVTSAPVFSASHATEPFDKTTKTWAKGFGSRFDCPQGGDIVTVRFAVPILRLFRFLDFTGRIMSDRTQLLLSTSVFRAESYPRKNCT